MCEQCEKMIETCWAEVRDLMNYNRKMKGPVAEKLESAMEKLREVWYDEYGEDPPEHAMENSLTNIRCELIAVRMAVIVRYLDSGPLATSPISAILANWAGEAMRVELFSPPQKMISNLLHVPNGDDGNA